MRSRNVSRLPQGYLYIAFMSIRFYVPGPSKDFSKVFIKISICDTIVRIIKNDNKYLIDD